MTEDAARISLADSTSSIRADDITWLGAGLPAGWAGAEPAQIVSALVDALLGMLHLSFVFVRLSAPDRRPSIEMMRAADSFGGTDRAREIRAAIDAFLGDAPPEPPSRSTASVGEADLSIASARLGLDGEIGVIVAGSERRDFPAQIERRLLDVAANQATIGLQHAYLTEQRQVARENEHSSRLLVDSIPGFIAAFTPAGELEFVNRPILDYFGTTFEELKHWGTGGTTHPDDLPRIVALFTRSIASGDPFEFEVRARRFDGVYRWFQSRGLPLRDTNGHIVRWYNLLIDIDERKRAEEELRLSEARKAAILNSALECIVTIDHEGCITEFNPAAERTFGYRRDEVLGRQLADAIIPPALRAKHRQGFARYLATGETRVLGQRIELAAVRADGSEFPAELAITRIPVDGPPSFTGYLRDITERRRSEEELRRSEAFLAEGQQLSRVGSFSWRVATDEITCSEQFYRIFNLDRDVRVTFEVIGTRVHPEDLSGFEEQIERSRRDGSDVQLEIRLQMPDRAVKYVHIVAHRRDDSVQREYIGAVQDVTQRRRSEEALAKVRSELAYVSRATSLGVLTASIAHEVNQPLAGIITNAGTCLRMLDADPPDVDGARETARRTIRDGNRASDVMTRLRALFSKKEFSLEPVDLNEATREVIALSLSDLHRHRVILQSELADDLPIITGDRIQLQQVILNLLRNASDAMVEVHERPRLLLIKTEREDGNRVRLTVRDAGIGFPSQSLDSLFDAFYTTKSGGMGIGLFVSRSIVERHQGRLWAELHDGPGATFSFSIPVSADMAAAG
jgi:PAS domain S-box-containing protein